MPGHEAIAGWWGLDAEALLRRLDASAAGLSAAAGAERLRRHGPNELQQQDRLSVPRLLLRQFQSPLVLILVFGAVVSLVVREWVDASVILAIVLGSTLLGFGQEYRASRAVAQLRQRLALTVRVLRDGIEITLPVRELVPGDVVMLAAGNLVPADGRVLAARDFLVTEASLTGESFPVEKQPGTVEAAASLAARTNAVFLGTSVRSGSATVLVVETGRATAFGAVAALIAARAPETEFERGIRRFGYLLVRVMLAMVVFVLVVNQLLGRPVLESLLFAMALAVGITPELLPAIVSVTLSRGARAMARRGVIIRRLDAIENLGSMDVLCTDKTGTLTAGVVALDAAVDAEGNPSAAVRRLAFLNAALETGIDNPLDAALTAAGLAAGLDTQGCTKVDEIPYDFIRRRLLIAIAEEAHPGEHLLIVKGAVGNVFDVCTRVRLGGVEVELDAAWRERLEAHCRLQGEQGFRVLAVATRRLPARAGYGHDDENTLCVEGFLHFFDPPKPGVADTLRELAALGVGTRIITGDNRHVAAHLAAAVGLDPSSMLCGEELAQMKDEALWHLAPLTQLFVEVDPQQKERIVRALQRTGHTVGYLGDGINDAPALHCADVGISVDGAVDVARDSADVVLLRTDLEVLREGIAEGRRTFANTLKYINITTSANFGNMVSMAIATPLLPFLPLAAKQILLNNFLSDLPALAIATDNVDPGRIERVARWSVSEVQRFMLVFGLVSTVFDLLAFGVLLHFFDAGEAEFQTAWFGVSLLTEIAVLLVLRTGQPLLRSRPGRPLLWLSAAVALLAFALPFTGAFAALFGFVPLPPALLCASVLIVLGYVVCTEAIKRRWFSAWN